MRRRFAALVLAGLAFLPACGKSKPPPPARLEPHAPRPYPGPPASLQLQLRADGDNLIVEQSQPRNDGGLAFHLEDHLGAAREGVEALYHYRILAPSGKPLGDGHFVVPLRGRVTYLSPREPRRVVHQATQPVEARAAVLIPFHRDAAALEVTRLVPGEGAVETWKHGPAVRVALQPQPSPSPGG